MFGKKKKKLFGNEIEPDCGYCSSCREGSCTLGRPAGPCADFQYDPLKRTPKSTPELKTHDPEEFKL